MDNYICIDVLMMLSMMELLTFARKRHQEKIMTILDGRITKQNFSENRSKIDSEAQSIVKAEQL